MIKLNTGYYALWIIDYDIGYINHIFIFKIVTFYNPPYLLKINLWRVTRWWIKKSIYFHFYNGYFKMLKTDHVMNNFEHFIELYSEVWVWTWRNWDGFWQKGRASYWFGQAITSLFGVRRFEPEFSIRLFVKYFRGWFMTSCESILGVAEAVVKSSKIILIALKNILQSMKLHCMSIDLLDKWIFICFVNKSWRLSLV